MEPSLGSWATSPADAEGQVAEGFRNFLLSMEDFILHFCIRDYLCQRGETYHITDLTKGAMPVRRAEGNRSERYDRWYPLLLEELSLLAKPSTVFYAIGRAVEEYLLQQRFGWPLKRILHYSGQAARHRDVAVRGREDQFQEFAQTFRPEAVLAAAEEVMIEAGTSSQRRAETLSRLRRGQFSMSRKKLAFTYYIHFTERS